MKSSTKLLKNAVYWLTHYGERIVDVWRLDRVIVREVHTPTRTTWFAGFAGWCLGRKPSNRALRRASKIVVNHLHRNAEAMIRALETDGDAIKINPSSRTELVEAWAKEYACTMGQAASEMLNFDKTIVRLRLHCIPPQHAVLPDQGRYPPRWAHRFVIGDGHEMQVTPYRTPARDWHPTPAAGRPS